MKFTRRSLLQLCSGLFLLPSLLKTVTLKPRPKIHIWQPKCPNPSIRDPKNWSTGQIPANNDEIWLLDGSIPCGQLDISPSIVICRTSLELK